MTSIVKNLKNFHRMMKQDMLGGVASGMAYSLAWPLWIIRSAWLMILLFYPVQTLIVYFALVLCVDEKYLEDSEFNKKVKR